MKRPLAAFVTLTLSAGITAPAVALPYCYMQDASGEITNLEDMCAGPVAEAPTPEPVAVTTAPQPGQLPATVQAQIAPPTAEVASRRYVGSTGQTEVKLLIRFDRNAPDAARATATVTANGQSQSVTVVRGDGRVQRPEVVLAGNVHGSAISVSAR